MFLLDENVDFRLFKFLKLLKIDTKLAPKALTDKDIAKLCLKEKWILVTNDEDFQEYPEDEIYSVVWLRVSQNRPEVLTKSFKLLLSECKNFKGKFIILEELSWREFPLPQNLN